MLQSINGLIKGYQRV